MSVTLHLGNVEVRGSFQWLSVEISVLSGFPAALTFPVECHCAASLSEPFRGWGGGVPWDSSSWIGLRNYPRVKHTMKEPGQREDQCREGFVVKWKCFVIFKVFLCFNPMYDLHLDPDLWYQDAFVLADIEIQVSELDWNKNEWISTSQYSVTSTPFSCFFLL